MCEHRRQRAEAIMPVECNKEYVGFPASGFACKKHLWFLLTKIQCNKLPKLYCEITAMKFSSNTALSIMNKRTARTYFSRHSKSKSDIDEDGDIGEDVRYRISTGWLK